MFTKQLLIVYANGYKISETNFLLDETTLLS